MTNYPAFVVSTSKKTSKLLPAFYIIVGSLLFGVLAFNIFRPIIVLPRITLAPGYALINQSGQTVTSESRRGKISLYSFSYTNCQSAECPQSVADIGQVWTMLQENVPASTNFDLLTIALDGDAEMPAEMPAATSNSFNWHWLTGESYLIKSIVGGGFDMYFSVQSDKPPKFEPRYVLTDGGGVIRAIYLDAVPDSEELIRDVNFLIEEAENSDGALRLAYEAAHLFSCYPR